MSIKIYLPDRLRRLLPGGGEVFEADGSTIGGCLDEILKEIPRLEKTLFFKKSRLRSNIKVSVNEEDDMEHDLSERVEDGDKIYISMRKN